MPQQENLAMMSLQQNSPSTPTEKPISEFDKFETKINEEKRKFLQEEINEAHIRKIAEKLVKWENKIDLFGLDSTPNVEDIKQKINDPSSQR